MDKATIRDKEVVYGKAGMPKDRVVLPTFDKVLIRRDEAPERIGIVWIPPTVRADQPVLSGTVVATGPLTQYVSPGEYVVFSQYAGSNVKVDGINYIVMREGDVHVIIRSL
jgi:chaperonin GroES